MACCGFFYSRFGSQFDIDADGFDTGFE